MPTDAMRNPEAVYTLKDLADWPAQAPTLAVLGHPVEHSLSPRMHNAALERLAGEGWPVGDWAYLRFDIEAERLGEALPLFLERGFLGLNLTVPHKVEAVAHVARLDPLAERMGAVNTLVATSKGWYGYNTDGFGLERALDVAFNDGEGIGFRESEVVLLGAGGASRAAAVQALNSGCRKLWVGNRSQDRLETFLKLFEGDNRVAGFALPGLPAFTQPAPYIINATSLGLGAEDPSPIGEHELPVSSLVYDMIYNPPMTRLLADAKGRNLQHCNGLGMLVWQGARALVHWLDRQFEGRRTDINTIAMTMLSAVSD